MSSLVQFLSILFLISFCLPFAKGTTVSYVSPNVEKTFCMSPEMHEQCGAYCYQTFKPVLEHVVELTEEIARRDEDIKKTEEFVEKAKDFALSFGSYLMDAFDKDIQLSIQATASQGSKP